MVQIAGNEKFISNDGRKDIVPHSNIKFLCKFKCSICCFPSGCSVPTQLRQSDWKRKQSCIINVFA